MLTTVSSFVDKYGANATNGGQLIVGAVAISAILGLAAYIALQLPEIASGLAGGGATLSARTAEYVAQAYVGSAAKASVAAALGSIGVAAAAPPRDQPWLQRRLRCPRADGTRKRVEAVRSCEAPSPKAKNSKSSGGS